MYRLVSEQNDPQRKEYQIRIFFCALPDEQERTLSILRGDLEREFEAELFYLSDPACVIGKEEAEENLKETDLVVIPVTGRLLQEESYVFETVVPYAAGSGIGILPIRMEQTDEEIFAEKFAEIPHRSAFKTFPVYAGFEEHRDNAGMALLGRLDFYYDRISDLLRDDPEACIEACRNTVRIGNAIRNFYQSRYVNQRMAGSWFNRGIALEKLGRNEEYLIAFARTVDYYEMNLQKYDLYPGGLSNAYYNLGKAYTKAGKPEMASYWYDKDWNFTVGRVKKVKDLESYRRLGVVAHRYFLQAIQAEDSSLCETYASAEIIAYKAVHDHTGNDEDYLDLGEAYYAGTYGTQEVRQRMKNARRIAQELIRKDPGNQLYRKFYEKVS